MKIRIDRSFDKDVDRIKDAKVIKKLHALISKIAAADDIQDLPVKKIEGYTSFYRIRLGDYRLGFEARSDKDKEIVLIRILHRKDIYRYFPIKR